VATKPQFASREKHAGRRRTKPVVQPETSRWPRSKAGRVSTRAERPQQFNGRYKIPTFQEVLDLAAPVEGPAAPIAIYPETKNPTFFPTGLRWKTSSSRCSTGPASIARLPVYVQSFERAV